MEKHILCKTDEFPNNNKKVFNVGKLSVVVIRNKDQYYALRNACPHQGAPLGEGRLAGGAMPTSEVGHYCYEKQGEVLYCPWHHWHFDVSNGKSIHDPENTKVKTYEVLVEDGNLVLIK